MSDIEIQRLLDDSDFKETSKTGKELIKAVHELLGTRKLTLKHLHTLKIDVEESYDKSRKARIGGTAATVTGSALAIAGFGLSFFTFGASLGLLIPGAVIAGAGGVTIAGAEIGYLAVSQAKLQDAKNACKADRQLMMEVKELGDKFFKQLDFLAEKHNSSWEKMIAFVHYSWNSKSGVRALYGGYKSIDAIFEAGKAAITAVKAVRVAAVAGRTVWSTLSTTGRVIGAAGAIFDFLFIPVDLAVMVKSAYDVHKYKTEGESNSNVAKEIGELIKALDNNRDDLQKFSDGLGTTS